MSIVRTIVPLMITVGLAIFAALNVGNYLVFSGKIQEIAPWESFFSVFGMSYAIIAGFLLLDVLRRFSDLSQTFEAELNAVEDVRDFLVYVDGGQEEAKSQIRKELLEYVRSVSEDEWKDMPDPKKPVNSDTSKELYDVMEAVNKLEVTNPSDSVALRSLIEKLSDITSFRTRRIALAKERLPVRLKLLLAFMSTTIVAVFILLSLKANIIHLIMVGAVTFSVHLLYMIVTDLDEPFTGHWNIDKAPLDQVKHEFEAEFGKSEKKKA